MVKAMGHVLKFEDPSDESLYAERGHDAFAQRRGRAARKHPVHSTKGNLTLNYGSIATAEKEPRLA
jgi:hypothetical protein